MKITETTSLEIRMKIAEDTNTPVKTLVQLSRDKDWVVRRGIAQNLNTPAKTLVLLSQDKDDWVRRRVAENPRTPTEALVRLSQDTDGWASYYAVRHPSWTEPSNQERIKELEPLVELEKELGVELF